MQQSLSHFSSLPLWCEFLCTRACVLLLIFFDHYSRRLRWNACLHSLVSDLPLFLPAAVCAYKTQTNIKTNVALLWNMCKTAKYKKIVENKIG